MSELVKRLQSLFVLQQLSRLVEVCERVAKAGYGEVVIEFYNGKPRFVKVVMSEDFSPIALLKRTSPPTPLPKTERGAEERSS